MTRGQMTDTGNCRQMADSIDRQHLTSIIRVKATVLQGTDDRGHRLRQRRECWGQMTDDRRQASSAGTHVRAEIKGAVVDQSVHQVHEPHQLAQVVADHLDPAGRKVDQVGQEPRHLAVPAQVPQGNLPVPVCRIDRTTSWKENSNKQKQF